MTDTLVSRSATNVHAGISFDSIVSIMRQRRSQQSLLITQMIDIRDRYNGDVVLPLPDVDKQPEMEPPVPRLIAQAIDGTSMRAASPAPTIWCPAMGTTQRAEKEAMLRQKVLYARWFSSQLKIKLYRSYRHLTGYGTCAWIVMPDDSCKQARIELRDPLTAYPELRSPDDIRSPRNVGFIFGRSIDWITARYPEARDFFYNSAGKNWDTLWDMVEWIDEDEIVVGILGPRMPAYGPQDARPYGYNGLELRRWANKAGMVPLAMPQRVTLDRIAGQMSTMIGTVDLHTRMQALEVLAAERHVFPDLYILGEPNQNPVLSGGQWYDGRTGKANLISGARSVGYLSTQPNPSGAMVIEQLEEAIRETGGASGMFGGQNTSTQLRTGAALGAMGSFSIDPRVEEVQRIQEAALSHLGEAVIAVEKGYFPSAKHFSVTGLQGEDRMVEYSPSDLSTGACVVNYPIPGADISQVSVAIAQLTGSGLMSKHTGRVKHPYIDDAEQEERQIDEEMLRSALIGGISQQAAQGAIPPVDVARILELLSGGAQIETAVATAQKEAQERQATQAPPPGQGQVGSPAAMPGLGAPGQGAEQPGGPPSIPAPPVSLANFHSLIRNINSNPSVAPTGGPPGAT